jgi:hypothetical protein
MAARTRTEVTVKNDHWRNVQLDPEKVDVSTLGRRIARRCWPMCYSSSVRITKSDTSAILRTTGRLIREVKAKI